MRIVAVAVALVALLAPASASAQPVETCRGLANVAWDTDTVTVTAAVVEVPGCGDGTEVGLQLITDDGDLPAEPLRAEVEDEHATFDLTPLDVRIEPVTGVRVLLHGDELAAFAEVTVDQRYFNRPGNEQVGLRETTVLQVPAGDQYSVPDAPVRYRTVECADVGLPADDEQVGEGPGTFTATASGVHRVCYQQFPGPQGGREADPNEPAVVDSVAVLGSRFGPDGGVVAARGLRGESLAVTGGDLATAALLGTLLVLGGLGLRRVRRWRRT